MDGEIVVKDVQTVKEGQKYDTALEQGKRLTRLFKKAYSATGMRSDELREAIAFYEGDQYLLAELSDTTPWVVQMKTPHAKNAIDTRTASITASDYIGELQPLSVEDIESVGKLNEMVADEWERMNMNGLVDNAIHDAAYMREGYVHIVYDRNITYGGKGSKRKGVLCAYQIDAPSVFIDPNARQWSDAQYIVITGRIPQSVAIDKYGELVRYIKPKQGGLSEFERGEVSVANDYSLEQDGFLSILTFYQKEEGIIVKRVVLENLLVKEDRLTALTRFPIAQFRWYKKKQNCYGISLMDDIITIQKSINSIESATTNIALSSASPAVIVQKGQGLNPEAVADTWGAPSMVYAVNGDPRTAIVPINTGTINPTLIQIKNEQEESLKRAAGISDAFTGSLGTSGNTSSGSEMAIERAKVIEGSVLINVEEFVEELVNIMIEFITSQYAGESIKSVKKLQTGGYEAKTLQLPADLKGLQYKFSINLNKRTPFSKDKERRVITELWQMERQYDAPLKLITALDILDKYDLSNKDELVERYKSMTAQSNEDKAQVISQLTKMATDAQLDPEMLNAAIVEIISGAKETPAVDALTQAYEQAMQAMQQQQAQQEQMAQQQAQQAQQAQQEQGKMIDEVAQDAAGQLVNQMPQEQVIQMAQQQGFPQQVANQMGGGQPPAGVTSTGQIDPAMLQQLLAQQSGQ